MDVNGVVNLQYPRWTDVAPFSTFSGEAISEDNTAAETEHRQHTRSEHVQLKVSFSNYDDHFQLYY